MQYRNELIKAMRWLATKEDTIFLGQSVRYPGHALFNTLEEAEVPMDKRIEMPVAEEMQMGISTGLSLMGYVPISIYPRMDFLIIAMNQLVNHLDKIPEMSCGEYEPKVIIRTAVGSKTPLDGGLQHTSDYTVGLSHLLGNVDVVKLEKPRTILNAYRWAYKNDRPTILVEVADLYDSESD